MMKAMAVVESRPTLRALPVPAPVIAGMLWLPLGWFVVLQSVNILPDRYFFDHVKLLEAIYYPDAPTGLSFARTALLYRVMYPFGVPDRVIVGLVNYTIVITLVVACMMSAPITRRLRDYVWLTSWCILAALYVGMLSKEVFTIAVAALVVLMLRTGRAIGVAAAIAVVVLYGVGVRRYWLAIPFYAAAIWALAASRPRFLAKVAGFIAVLALASTAVHVLTGVYITDARTVMNITRLEASNVASMVLNPLPNSSAVTDVANHLWAWINFLLPIRLLSSGVPQQMAFAVWQMLNVAAVATALVRARRWLPKRTHCAMASFVIAVTLVLAAFDGDFGSYNRHQITLLPVVAFILGVGDGRVQAEGLRSVATPSPGRGPGTVS
jgi:hypothetical protein